MDEIQRQDKKNRKLKFITVCALVSAFSIVENSSFAQSDNFPRNHHSHKIAQCNIVANTDTSIIPPSTQVPKTDNPSTPLPNEKSKSEIPESNAPTSTNAESLDAPKASPTPTINTPTANDSSDPTAVTQLSDETGGSDVPTSINSSNSQYRVILRTQPNNNGLISADTYLLNSHGAIVKQVGHAEVEQDLKPANEALTQGSTVYKNSTDSPFSFELTISDETDDEHGYELKAILTNGGLFNGSSLTNADLLCHVYR